MSKTVFFITPDYASHFNPFIPIGMAFKKSGYKVVVATGYALMDKVQHCGFQHTELILGAESNSGLISPRRRAEIEDSFRATQEGWISALLEQSETRLHHLLWNAEDVAAKTLKLLELFQPDYVLAVQLTYQAVAALLAVDAPFATFVTGHPTQLPTPDEIYGYPSFTPSALKAPQSGMDKLQKKCREVQQLFTEEFNQLIHSINPRSSLLQNGLAAASPRLILFNYPPQLIRDRQALFPHGRFLGSSVRKEALDTELECWLSSNPENKPTIYFSFGSYFSVHLAVLHRVVSSLRDESVRVLFATGVADPNELGEIPRDWLARRYFPQVAALSYCDVVICHGGNNTVTEALTAGSCLVVAPFASDQFGNAYSVEQHSLGTVFDPNQATIEDIRGSVLKALEARPRVASLGCELRQMNGPEQARIWCQELL